MNKLLAVCSVFLLAGCTTIPVERTFPDAPPELLDQCPDLSQVPETEQLSVVLETINENYGLYHMCKNQNSKWIEWYRKQREIFNSVD